MRTLTIRDAGGNIEIIQTTDEHPFWVEGLGWTSAGAIGVGNRVGEADGSNDAVVVASERIEHPSGITVYNFEVEGDHTYFVEDGTGNPTTAVWVHNQCVGNEFIARIKVGTQGERFKGVKINWGGSVRSQPFQLRSSADTQTLQLASTGPKRDFVKSLGNDPAMVAALKSKGVSQTEVDDMIAKGNRPDGFEVHHKKPIEWGGDNSPENFVLLPKHPHHRSLTDEQKITTEQLERLGLMDQPGSNEFEVSWVDIPGKLILE